MIDEQHDDADHRTSWERQPGEGPQAFEDFREFLHQGSSRSYVATARRRGRSYSLIRRYAKRFDWRERARAWDNFHNRDLEDERRRARRAFAQRQEEEVQQLWRLGLALVYRFVRRDATNGEWRIDAQLAPKDVLALLKFVSDLLARIYGQIEGNEESPTQLELSWESPEEPAGTEVGITHPGLRHLLRLTDAEGGSAEGKAEEEHL